LVLVVYILHSNWIETSNTANINYTTIFPAILLWMRLLYRLLLQVDVTDRCANSEFYSNLTYFWNKAHIFSIVVINRKFIQTGSYDRKNNHNSYLIYFRWMNSSFWYNMFIKRHLLKIYRCIYIHLKKRNTRSAVYYTKLLKMVKNEK
jgi:hypothetical protein